MKSPKLKAESASRTEHKAESGAASLPLGGEGQVPAGEQLLDAKGVGKRLIMSPRTVSEMALEGRLPAYRIGIYLRFKWVDIDQFITVNCKVGAPRAKILTANS